MPRPGKGGSVHLPRRVRKRDRTERAAQRRCEDAGLGRPSAHPGQGPRCVRKRTCTGSGPGSALRCPGTQVPCRPSAPPLRECSPLGPVSPLPPHHDHPLLSTAALHCVAMSASSPGPRMAARKPMRELPPYTCTSGAVCPSKVAPGNSERGRETSPPRPQPVRGLAAPGGHTMDLVWKRKRHLAQTHSVFLGGCSPTLGVLLKNSLGGAPDGGVLGRDRVQVHRAVP